MRIPSAGLIPTSLLLLVAGVMLVRAVRSGLGLVHWRFAVPLVPDPATTYAAVGIGVAIVLRVQASSAVGRQEALDRARIPACVCLGLAIGGLAYRPDLVALGGLALTVCLASVVDQDARREIAVYLRTPEGRDRLANLRWRLSTFRQALAARSGCGAANFVARSAGLALFPLALDGALRLGGHLCGTAAGDLLQTGLLAILLSVFCTSIQVVVGVAELNQWPGLIRLARGVLSGVGLLMALELVEIAVTGHTTSQGKAYAVAYLLGFLLPALAIRPWRHMVEPCCGRHRRTATTAERVLQLYVTMKLVRCDIAQGRWADVDGWTDTQTVHHFDRAAPAS